jgi:hypothetical protein
MPGMAELVDHGLPLNRKERFYTATVLPMLVCADDFAHLDRLLAMAGLTDILSNSAGSGVQVFSEYGYWESIHPLPDTDPDAPATRDTPDLVLFLLGPSRRLLVLIEAKLYHRPSRAALGEQLSAQAGLLTPGSAVRRHTGVIAALMLQVSAVGVVGSGLHGPEVW